MKRLFRLIPHMHAWHGCRCTRCGKANHDLDDHCCCKRCGVHQHAFGPICKEWVEGKPGYHQFDREDEIEVRICQLCGHEDRRYTGRYSAQSSADYHR